MTYHCYLLPHFVSEPNSTLNVRYYLFLIESNITTISEALIEQIANVDAVLKYFRSIFLNKTKFELTLSSHQ